MKKQLLLLLPLIAVFFALYPTQKANAAPFCRACFNAGLKQCGVTLQTQTPASRACSHAKMLQCADKTWGDIFAQCSRPPRAEFIKTNAACFNECKAKKNIKTRKQARACVNACWNRHATQCTHEKYKKACGK